MSLVYNYGNNGFVDIYDYYDLVQKKSFEVADAIIGLSNNEGMLRVYWKYDVIHYQHASILRNCWEESGDIAPGPSILNEKGELCQIIGNISFWSPEKYVKIDIEDYKK